MTGYDIKIRLDDCRPLTWRDLIIPAGITFEEMHKIIQIVYNFYDIHLYAFRIKDLNVQINRDEFEDFQRNDMGEFDGVYASKTLINEFFEKCKKISYLYDFGDSWNFTIEIKKTVDYEKRYPTIKRYKGEYNPIEDIGGVYALMNLISYKKESINDLPDYIEENLEYLEEFDIDETQELLELNCDFKEKTTDDLITGEIISDESNEEKNANDDRYNEDDNGYELKIILNRSNPTIYRTIQVPKEITFRKLHDIIQIVYGFENRYKYQFIDLDENINIIDENDDIFKEKTKTAQKTCIKEHCINNQFL
ncbi:MAG: hypothetical protein Q4Q22_08435, partial [Methanosphaera sp.]|nr:hypothetical protein [Methanosphaera sp.]